MRPHNALPDVTVMTPTFRRPAALARALESVALQQGLAGIACEVLVVDNAPDGDAAAVVEALRPRLSTPLIYVHEPRPGVANARNAGLAAATGAHVAFLDDDEVASPRWLAALRETHLALGADVTFGPVHGRAPDAPAELRPLLERFFSRADLGATGLLDSHDGGGCGNSMMRRATALAGDAPFDPAANETGGEDDRLFQALHARGGVFAWAADAHVDEMVPPERSTLAYAVRRNFAYGQGPTKQRLRARDRMGAAGWMAVGAAQAAGHGSAALALRALGQPAWRCSAVSAAAGFGKMLPSAEIGFYGLAALRRGSASAPATATNSVV